MNGDGTAFGIREIKIKRVVKKTGTGSLVHKDLYSLYIPIGIPYDDDKAPENEMRQVRP